MSKLLIKYFHITKARITHLKVGLKLNRNCAVGMLDFSTISECEIKKRKTFKNFQILENLCIIDRW